MNIVLQYILIGILLYFFVTIFSKLFIFYWQKGYDNRKKKAEERKQEKLKWKYAHIQNGNPLLERIISNKFIIFKGELGKGKTITMNLTSHYIWQKQLTENQKQKRYQKTMNLDYFNEWNKLDESKLLPVYTSPNLDFIKMIKKQKYKSQDLIPYITLQKRAIYKPIFIVDEFSSLFPKEMYQENQRNPSPIVDEMKELFKKNRHYTNGWILGTEQDGEDIFIGFRKNGYAVITALGTIIKLSKKGKVIRWFKNLVNICVPALFTVNLKNVFQKELFLKDKILLIFKLLLPSYFYLPYEFYTQKQNISNKTKEKHQQYQTLLEFEGQKYYIRFTNNDIFQYDTRAYKNEYQSKFDKNGSRKVIQEAVLD